MPVAEFPVSEATVDQEAAESPPRSEESDNGRSTKLAQAEEKPRTKRQPPYAVILHNDDYNTMDFVVLVLAKVFHMGLQKAVALMAEAHTKGRCVVWSGALEHAELKADQIRSCGADPVMKAHGALPLRVTVEPLPG